MSGYPIEKFIRIKKIVADENTRKAASDNHII